MRRVPCDGYRPAMPVTFDGLDQVLARWRRASGESRREVRERARVGSASVQRYESGERLPRADELSRLLVHYGRDLYDLADELAVIQGETPREAPVPMVAIGVSADEWPGASREQLAELLAERRRLLYYEERRQRTQEAIDRLRAEMRGARR